MSDTPTITGATIRVAIVVDGKVDEIINHRLGSRDLVRECQEIIDISARPDIKVGDTLPFSSWADYQDSLNKGAK